MSANENDEIIALNERLASIKNDVKTIKEHAESKPSGSTPQTTLEIVGRESSEGAWQRYLRYFLDPGEAHGLDTIFLNDFLEMLQNAGIISQSLRPTYSDVIVRKEVPGESSRPDLLIYEPEEWFVCFELKIGSQERPGQTEDHVESPVLGKIEKANFPPKQHYYLYVAPDWAGDGDAKEFTACPWFNNDEPPSIVSTISTVLERKANNAPTRTVVQLEEFRETIINELSMTTIDKETRALKELYVENKSYINRLEDAFEEYTDWFFNIRVPEALNGEYQPSFWNEEWEYNRYADHTKIYHSSWRPGDDIDVHLEYYPEPEKLIEGTIFLRFDIEFKGDEWESSDGRRPQQVFADELLSYLDQTKLPDETTVTETADSRIHKLLKTKYEFEVNSDEDYIAALQGALEDMTPVVPAVNKTLDTWGTKGPNNSKF